VDNVSDHCQGDSRAQDINGVEGEEAGVRQGNGILAREVESIVDRGVFTSGIIVMVSISV
jgi:hypothetical protein